MRISLRWVVLVQCVMIMGLLVALFSGFYDAKPNVAYKIKNESYSGLLSPRVYAGLLEPKSYLIVNYGPLRDVVSSYIEDNHLNVSVYVVNMRDGASMSINGNQKYVPASLSKVPLAILILKRVEEGELSLDQEVEITSEDRVTSWGDLYKTTQQKVTIRFLLEKMLRDSDNTAFLVLNRYKKNDEFTILLRNYLGYYVQTKENSTLEAAQMVTVRSLYSVFSSLYLSTILDPQDSEYILSLLSNTTFDVNTAYTLPPEVKVSHKFGALYNNNDEKYFHDCGIIYMGVKRVFYCVMTKDLDEKQAVNTIGLIVKNIYLFTDEVSKGLEDYKNNQNNS